MKNLFYKLKWIILSPFVYLKPENDIYRTDYARKTWYIPYPKRWMSLWAKDFMTTHVRFENVLKPGDVVIEVGACTGEYTVPVSELLGPTGHIYAFEADQISYKCLSKNIEASNMRSSITIEHRGVSDKDGETLKLQLIPNSIASSSFHGSNKGKEQISVQTVTLDSYFTNHPDKKRIALLKLTVNGHEPEIISGASKLLQHIEYVTFQSARYNEAIDILQNYGFEVVKDHTLYTNMKSVLLRKNNPR